MPHIKAVKRRSSPKTFVCLLALLLLLPGRALAWGSEGHQIIADIAEQYLQPATAQQVHELLALENVTTLAAVSMWADDITRPAAGDRALALRQHSDQSTRRHASRL